MPTTMSSLADRFGPPRSYSGFVGPFAVGGGAWYGSNPKNLTSYPTMTAGSKQPYVPQSTLAAWAPDHPSADPASSYWGWVQAQQNQAQQQAGQAAAGGVQMGATGLMPGQSGATGYQIPSSAIGVIPQTPSTSGRTKKAGVGQTQTSQPAVNDPVGAYISNLLGTTQSGSGVWGSVPNVPDPTSTAGAAISGDIANLGSLFGLAGATNTFNNQQAIAPYIANLPGYQGMVNQSSQNILAGLEGKLPPDVIALLQQQGAEGGVAQGMGPGSDNVNSAYLRSLGLTSLGQQQQAEQNLTGAIQRTPTAPLFNVASFMNTPADQQAAQMAANMYASAPNPQQQGQFLMSLFERMLANQAGAGGGGVTRSAPGGGGGPPTDLFGQPWTGLGGGASPGASGGGGYPGGPGSVSGGAPPGYGFNPMLSGDAGNVPVGTMPYGGYGRAQGPNEGTGEGTVSGPGQRPGGGGTPGFNPNYSTGPYGFNPNDPIWQSILDPVGFEMGDYESGGTSAGQSGRTPGLTSSYSTGPYGFDPNDPIWQSILDPTGYYMGDYAPQGQTPQDITPQGMAGGFPDYLNPGFVWSQLMDPYSSGGFDFSGYGDFGDFGDFRGG